MYQIVLLMLRKLRTHRKVETDRITWRIDIGRVIRADSVVLALVWMSADSRFSNCVMARRYTICFDFVTTSTTTRTTFHLLRWDIPSSRRVRSSLTATRCTMKKMTSYRLSWLKWNWKRFRKESEEIRQLRMMVEKQYRSQQTTLSITLTIKSRAESL